MKIPAITGIIRRRLLLNYRIAPELVQSILPSPFRPKIFKGYAIGGICLIRLEKIRPKHLRGAPGISSENSAHRFAIEWEDNQGEVQEGVFVSRRDTDSRLNALAGGRVFPGTHDLSRFDVSDQNGTVSIRIISKDADPLVDIEVGAADDLPETSIFEDISESSSFFERGCQGFSPRPNSCQLDGLLLQTKHWQVSPLTTRTIRSAFFGDTSRFPTDSIAFDHALMMRDVPHEWHSITSPEPG